jgi:DNA-binding CsgD family transcriptional regulator
VGDRLQTRLKKLTENEAAILRLLARGYDVKASATELGITPNSVTERLRSARQKLGVSSSREAARIYASHSAPDHIFYVPTGNVVEQTTPFDPASDLPDGRAGDEVSQTAAVLEQSAIPFAHKPVSLVDLSYLPLRRAGETRNELNTKQRLSAIFDLTTKFAGGVALTCLLALIIDRLVASL